ncbi:metal ABC transporter permease [Candidatus Bathyarchaeota archaeon]|nr:MAG: metal ABC transporter permease [Candidatus Bathyarchaeota archaeon]
MLEVLQYEFMRNALLAGLLASVACGLIGVIVVVKRMVSISGGISHAAFGGIGLGYFLGFDPILGALLFTVVSALGIGVLRGRTKLSEDAAVGILWVTGMSLGVILISLTPGYAPNLFAYLFGSILTVPTSDLIEMAVLDVIIITTIFLFYEEFMAISFDESFAFVVGVPVERIYLLLLSLIALTVVVLIRIVGVILVIAMLTIPATISWQFSYKLKEMMLLSVMLSAIFTMGGLWLSFTLDLASGATIVMLSVATFLLTSLYKVLLGK